TPSLSAFGDDPRFRGRLMAGLRALNPPVLVQLQPPELARPGRQSADHPHLKRGMLWVQVPPGLKESVLVEQSGVLATLSRWRSWVQIPSGTLGGATRWHGTQTGKAAKLKPW